MAMEPPVFVVDLFRFREWPEDRIRSERSMLVFLDALTNHDRLLLDEYPGLPALYSSGVAYRTEAGANRWLDIIHAIDRGWIDCKSLAAWRAAELRKRGIKAGTYVAWRRAGAGEPFKYHALVERFGPGVDHFDRAVNLPRWFEDPSRRLGMETPEGREPRGPDYTRALTPDESPGEPGAAGVRRFDPSLVAAADADLRRMLSEDTETRAEAAAHAHDAPPKIAPLTWTKKAAA